MDLLNPRDLDRGQVRRVPDTAWFDAKRPPFASLVAELSQCMGSCGLPKGSPGGTTQFRGLRAQAACARFIVDLLNPRDGFLGQSTAAADMDALSRLELLQRLADEAVARAQQDKTRIEAEALGVLRSAIHLSVGAMLAGVCADAAERLATASGGSSGPAPWHAGRPMLVDALIADTADAREPDCCGALAQIYAAQPFREWWGEPARSRSRAPERLQWLHFRAKHIDLIEYLRENHKSLKVLERSVEERLYAVWGDEAEMEADAPDAPDAPDAEADDVADDGEVAEAETAQAALDEAKAALAEAEAALVAAETAQATDAETDEAKAEEAKADDAPTLPADDADTSAVQGGALMEPPQPAASLPPPPLQTEVEI
jgi:hypothetical protein